jgi:hypothetical protein
MGTVIENRKLYWAIAITACIAICLSAFVLFHSRESDISTPTSKSTGETAKNTFSPTTKQGNDDRSSLIEAKFELAFLGKINCFAKDETLDFEINGKRVDMPFKVYYLKNGMPVRAEFQKKGAKDYEFTPNEIRRDYTASGISIVGFPAKPARVNFSRILKKLYEFQPFENATKINITWLVWDDYGTQEEGFIVNVWGVPFEAGKIPDEEPFRKYRVVFDSDGEPVVADNIL